MSIYQSTGSNRQSDSLTVRFNPTNAFRQRAKPLSTTRKALRIDSISDVPPLALEDDVNGERRDRTCCFEFGRARVHFWGSWNAEVVGTGLVSVVEVRVEDDEDADPEVVDGGRFVVVGDEVGVAAEEVVAVEVVGGGGVLPDEEDEDAGGGVDAEEEEELEEAGGAEELDVLVLVDGGEADVDVELLVLVDDGGELDVVVATFCIASP
ncbi:hypothetical protein D9611_010382 [Ephemerocybe angulata]|uniref:Uncharacterized protein n=1 Tax=Ephemerocybe angulata TaxID=980116 RepID=A0A8H5BBF3_9AGAR|nr:hypothetical protein D9611_010382 [Tulosesus angulatus]